MLTARERADRNWTRRRDRLVCQLLDRDKSLTSYEAVQRVNRQLREEEYARNHKGIEKQLQPLVADATPQEMAAHERARGMQLFLGFVGPADAREWRFYDAATGCKLGWWRPATGYYRIHGREGWGLGPDAVLDLVAGQMPADGVPVPNRKGSREPAMRQVFCEKCHAVMVPRVSPRTGRAFLGCSTFPKCTFTRDRRDRAARKGPDAHPPKVRPRTIEREKLAAELMAKEPGLAHSKALWRASRLMRAAKRQARAGQP